MKISTTWPHDTRPAFEGAKLWVLRAFDHATRRIALGLDLEPAQTSRRTDALLYSLLQNPELADQHARRRLQRLCELAPAAVSWVDRHRHDRHALDWMGFRSELLKRCEQILREHPHDQAVDD